MQKHISGITILLGLLFLPALLAGQACCTSGTPILGSLELPATPPGRFQTAVSYDYKSLQDLVDGRDLLQEHLRSRSTHSLLLEMSYGLSHSFSLSGLFSYVRQERRILPGSQETNTLTTQGVGDAVFLVKYMLIKGTVFSQRSLSIGVGPKIPIGKFQLRSDGIVAPYDMQPGTGAWDAILWANFQQGFRPFPVSAYATAAYRATGTNETGFEFGDEFIGNAGLTYHANIPVDFSIISKVRRVAPDRRHGAAIANTGGIWVSLVPGAGIDLGETFSLRFSGQVPVYRDLNGLQLTTSYRISLSVYSFL